jgi:hypothetical protein
MTTRRLTKAVIARALEALVEAGLPVGAVRSCARPMGCGWGVN